MAARVYDEVFGYIEDATKTLPGAAAPGELELPGEYVMFDCDADLTGTGNRSEFELEILEI